MVASQPYNATETKDELILVRLSIENKVSYDIDAFLIGKKIFIPTPYLFDMLKIRYTKEKEGTKYRVEFPYDEKTVVIDLKSDTTQMPRINESPEIIWYEEEAYLSVLLLEELFDFNFTFDFRKLTLDLSSRHKLPLIEDLNRKNQYSYINEGEEKNNTSFSPDEIVSSKRYLVNGWLADWTINNNYNFYQQPNISGNIGLGGQILGGSFNMNGSASGKNGVHWESMRGNWTYPVHSTNLIQQIQIGDVQQPGNIESSMSGFRGFLISNRPNLRPMYFKTQTYEGSLEEGWDVEFYVNRTLEDYELGSDRGRYNFNSPLFYGANHVQLKYYDAKGFHHQKQYLIQIPYDFLQPGKIEYDISAGEYASFSGHKYARSNIRLGVSPNITLGGGLFQGLDAPNNDSYPYLQSWFRVGKRMSLLGSYMVNHLVSGSIRYTLPKSQTINFSFKKYTPNEVFNRAGKQYEASFSTSLPVEVSFLRFSTFINSRYIRQQQSRQQLNINGGISAVLPLKVNMRINGRFTFRDENIVRAQPTQSALDLQLSRRVLKKIFLRTNIKYSHWHKSITNLGIKLDYRIANNVKFDVSIQRNNLLKVNQYMLRLRLDLPFARHTSYTRGNTNTGSPTLNQNTTGSISINPQTGIHFDDQRKVGRASLMLNPFLDENNNGLRDANEPVLDKISANLYRQSRNQEIRSKSRFIENLVPYERYTVEVIPQSLNNPFWQTKKTTWSVQVLPNMVNTLNIPVVAVGEVSGVISSQKHTDNLYGLSVEIISEENDFSEVTQTYSGGHYYYVGLMPGKYVAALDKEQLSARSLIVEEDSISFTVNSSQEGDIVEGVNFKIGLLNNNEVLAQQTESLYAIQISAFKEHANAKKFIQEASQLIGEPVTIFFDEKDKIYKCIVGEYKQMEAVKDKLFEILKFYPYPFIIKVER